MGCSSSSSRSTKDFNPRSIKLDFETIHDDHADLHFKSLTEKSTSLYNFSLAVYNFQNNNFQLPNEKCEETTLRRLGALS